MYQIGQIRSKLTEIAQIQSMLADLVDFLRIGIASWIGSERAAAGT